MRLAVAFRNEFGRDVLIDLVGYRRFGHNETDEPAYTQPQMYEAIKAHPPVREVYAKQLEEQGVVSRRRRREHGRRVLRAGGRRAHRAQGDHGRARPTRAATRSTRTMSREPKTTLPEDTLRSLNEQLLRVPDGFNVHRKLKPFLQRRRDAAEEGGRVDWAHAESLAFASLLALGVPVRMTGQDTERGTFSQRHLVFHDAENGDRFTPLQNISSAVAPFELHNSPLSEQACVGFEYGYSAADPEALVLWEAQFGDFVNSAQVILDQFLVSGLAKWGATSRLTLLLPHGYEGSGPEHSSGRVERFLQACAEGNMRVANTTTPAQYFHLLRRQALVSKAAAAGADDAQEPAAPARRHVVAGRPVRGRLQARARRPDAPEDRSKVTKLVLCSGKVYYDIAANEDREKQDHIAVARVEMLYPFPDDELRELMESYPNLERVVWVQEEPRNMGPRAYMRRRMAAILPEDLHYFYVGRQLRAAQSEGYTAAHRKEQARIVRVALDLEDDVLERDASAERPRALAVSASITSTTCSARPWPIRSSGVRQPASGSERAQPRRDLLALDQVLQALGDGHQLADPRRPVAGLRRIRGRPAAGLVGRARGPRQVHVTQAQGAQVGDLAGEGHRPIVTPRGLELLRVARHEGGRAAQGLAPARAGAGPGGVAVAHRGVEAQAGHHHVGVAAVGVHGDPAAGAAAAPAHQGARRHRRLQEAPAAQRVADGAAAVVARGQAGGEGAVARRPSGRACSRSGSRPRSRA